MRDARDQRAHRLQFLHADDPLLLRARLGAIDHDADEGAGAAGHRDLRHRELGGEHAPVQAARAHLPRAADDRPLGRRLAAGGEVAAEEGVVLEPPGSQIVGVVVLPALQLSPATPSPFVAGLGSIQGAMVSLGALGGLSGQAWPSVRFDPDVISRVLTDHGEWVRVPGGWRDY